MPQPPRILARPRRPIPGYERLYEITRRGHVYSSRAKKIIGNSTSTAFSEVGRELIQFQVEGKTIQMGVHKTIAEVWIEGDERKEILADLAEAKRTAGKGDSPYKIAGIKHDLRAQTVYYLECLTLPVDHPNKPTNSSSSQT